MNKEMLFNRPLHKDEMAQVMLLAKNAPFGEALVGFYRGFMLPAVGQDWDDYTEERSLPTTSFAIAEDQWKAICEVLIGRFGTSAAMAWMNIGPSVIR